ncbi:MAG: hypothetical protein HY909_21055 [Deltaproteobacteria bacterium]|nr:hypothetical protein [Deltaproteobacteria bacterium]
MKVRPLSVWVALGTSLVVWFAARMLYGERLLVWQVSALLGAWAPILAAGLFLHLRATSHRESSALAAWMVRALAMHSVLLWLVGANDWLRGPPGRPSHWNADLGGPVLLVAFVPVFLVTALALHWHESVAARLLGGPRWELLARVRPGRPARPAPYRGVAFDAREEPLPPFATRPWVVGLLGLGLSLLGVGGGWVVPGTVLGLAAVTAPGTRSVAPSTAALAVVTAAQVFGAPASDASALLLRGQCLPWLVLGASMAYLALCETRLRVAAAT